MINSLTGRSLQAFLFRGHATQLASGCLRSGVVVGVSPAAVDNEAALHKVLLMLWRLVLVRRWVLGTTPSGKLMPESGDPGSNFAASITVTPLGFTADKALSSYSDQDRLVGIPEYQAVSEPSTRVLG